MNLFVLIILGYLVYRFIAGFLFPLFRTTSHMRQQFQNMNREQNGQPGGHSTNGTRPAEPPPASKPGPSKVGEYIDFEEVK
jgi:hypothetical protein